MAGYSAEVFEVNFKINDEIITLSFPVDEKENLYQITNDGEFAVRYITQLINNGFISLNGPLQSIRRIDDNGSETIIYPIRDITSDMDISEMTENAANESEGFTTKQTYVQEEVRGEPTGSAAVKWSNECTFLLINLVEKFDAEFQTTIKQFVWKKIARIINDTYKAAFTATQVDTKWKGLKRTYHEVKKHNNTSGNNIRKWVFYVAIHNFLFKKPEINPPATCSSSKGLIIRPIDNQECNPSGTSQEVTTWSANKNKDKIESPPQEYTPSFIKKRKAVTAGNKRHDEKMKRMDRYLDLFERLVTAVEKK